MPCQGLGEHAHFANFGMAFLTLFRVATGDNWNGIMKDTLRDDCDDNVDCVKNCCVSSVIAPIFFVIFVLMAQFVLVNVVVAVLMKHLEESHKQMEDDMDIETELEREIEREQLFEEEQALCKELEAQQMKAQKRPLTKVSSLPSNFTYSTPVIEKKFNTSRRMTVQYFNPLLSSSPAPLSIFNYNQTPSSTIRESNENDLEEEVSTQRRASRPVNRKNLLNKFRTQSFDVKLLETSDSVEMDSQSNIKIGQSNGETASSSAINNNIMISKKPASGSANKKFNYRQSSLDFDNRSSACKYLIDNNSHNNASSSLGNKSSFLAVPRQQSTTRNRSGSAKQLFKQAALDEDEQTSESSLLLPDGNSGSLLIPTTSAPTVPQLQLPSGSGSVLSGGGTINDPPISIISSSSSSSSVGKSSPEPRTAMQTLTVDDGNDGNVKKSESCELLRVISERRKL